ncbi:hypothetical protein LUZ60_008892 [Juncus effusus]|nr:hypothetical protein LUZ60_008892 [Juncus effusus]
MPELPEVEVGRRALEEHCVGKRIVKCTVAEDSKVIDGVSPSDLEAALRGKTIVAALRKGKNLWLRLDSPPFPTFQFGMAGAIYIKGIETSKYRRSSISPSEEWPSKYSKVHVELDDGLEFSFTDKRRFAKVRLVQDPESVPPISELGPDALTEPMEVNNFINALSKKKTAIKSLLLDQSFISGIGNWIADEVLYQARIHPMEIASNLSKESSSVLHKCIKEVIKKAVEVGADSSQFPEDWIFHSREKKPGKAFVDGKNIDFITAGGRTTAYVPELQTLTVAGSSKAAQSKSHKGKASKDDSNSEDEKEAKKKSNKGKGFKTKPNKSDDDVSDDVALEEPVAKKRQGKSKSQPTAQVKKKARE